MHKYRQMARDSIQRAKMELAADDPLRYRYAALEVREAIEALIYERATVFKDDVRPEYLRIWQPRKLMQLLISIDPAANMGCTIQIGDHGPNDEPPTEMKLLGTETVLKLEDFKNHYDALGSFLHVPTIQKLDDGASHDLQKLKARCLALIPVIENVLTSTLFNVHIRNTATTACMRCGFEMRKRFPLRSKEVDVECFACGAPYLLKDMGGENVRWYAKRNFFKCEGDDCDKEIGYWIDQIKDGTNLECDGCNKKFHIAFGVFSGEKLSLRK